MKIAIIPARGGSKRIPRKNIKLFHGKPMIAYSIEAAIASGCFDKVIVSTDDQEIAGVAKMYGAEVPFLRPAEIAGDYATTMDVMAHAIGWCKQQAWNVEAVCCLYATAPFIFQEDLRQGYTLLQEAGVQFAFSATSFPFPIQRAIKLDEKGFVSMFSPEYEQARSQDLIEAYHDAGQFYWGQTQAFLTKLSIFSPHSRVVLLPRNRVQDIDTPEDWASAEALYAVLNK
ncbi:TPA: pseudaminic acid cytidylyltransferase [Vibrio cholerae]|uniref:pseudaminic acid cytidylyltransferase n=1 Tax=Vibrio cholerae TaxID=666 RepID=UPI0011D61958|nr:pseudaminic acid cytidylyltransferase [Vibrio cholerae]EGR3921542.1 pseudaminic acid cytidylyltransferase [Vibrio cholerae]TXY18655.1 pseudaminic acid cytidylyltransferase [Vibrio cholerae]BCN17035.1 putative monosaccharide biosynthesis protein [Vibrio cholerae]BCN18732.1 putative monosaccharide biosynthesis protein [Vibrio cholerae]GHY11202.1 pseudaminic acid cytidylyltransferase [Vibrio cholerae]